jgi:hypothetical protein
MPEDKISAGPPGPDRQSLLQALARLLRPLVRLLIDRGIAFPVLVDLLRTLYVDVATKDILTDPRARTDSRVSLLTGVHRKEVRKQREHTVPLPSVPQAVTLSSQILAIWLGSPAWTDASGQPLILPRTAADGRRSFDALVSSVTKDVRPRAVLDEWLARGIVHQDDAGSVVLDAAAFLPRPGEAEQMFYFARNLHDHIAAAVANVSASGSAPYLDRSVHYDAMPEAAAARLEATAREAGTRLLVEVNRAALQIIDTDWGGQGPTRRVNLGVYLFAEDEQAPPT